LEVDDCRKTESIASDQHRGNHCSSEEASILTPLELPFESIEGDISGPEEERESSHHPLHHKGKFNIMLNYQLTYY